MILEKFRVTNYRNIHDSGWIDVNTITAFAGQNEAGKSNLFEALYRVNPFNIQDTKFNEDEDWPVDKWSIKGKDKNAIACTVAFLLNDTEINDLVEKATAIKENEDAATTDTQPEKRALPDKLFISGIAYYYHAPKFYIEDAETYGLDHDLVHEWAKTNLPKFVYIHEYEMSGSQVELDQLLIRKNSQAWENLTNEDQTILIILELAKINLEEFIAKGQTVEGRTTRSFDKRAASAYLSQQFKSLWRQKDVKFDIEVDGTTLNIFVEDAAVGMPIRLSKRSTGFRWYVSFAWKFTYASQGQYENCILLLEEPGVHLHYDGQRDLLNIFNELAQKNTILYTTHLASMVSLSHPERVRLVESVKGGCNVKAGVVSSQKAPMAVIEASLGLSGDMSGLLGNRQTLIVEGGDDALILQKLSGLLKASKKTGLSDTIYLWPARGASHTPMYAGFAVGNKWDAGVLLDSDDAGNLARKKIDELYISKLAEDTKFFVRQIGHAAGIKKTDAAIEDLFPDEFYLECVNKSYGFAITLADLPVDGSDMITKKIEHVLKTRHGHNELDKRRILGELLKRFDTWQSIEDLPESTIINAENLFKSINEAFDPGHKSKSKIR